MCVELEHAARVCPVSEKNGPYLPPVALTDSELRSIAFYFILTVPIYCIQELYV
jgi:hypothetical protein